jgi:hypothetical protein
VNSRIRDFIRDVKPGGFSNYIYPIITDNWVYIYIYIYIYIYNKNIYLKIKFDCWRKV